MGFSLRHGAVFTEFTSLSSHKDAVTTILLGQGLLSLTLGLPAPCPHSIRPFVTQELCTISC